MSFSTELPHGGMTEGRRRVLKSPPCRTGSCGSAPRSALNAGQTAPRGRGPHGPGTRVWIEPGSRIHALAGETALRRRGARRPGKGVRDPGFGAFRGYFDEAEKAPAKRDRHPLSREPARRALGWGWPRGRGLADRPRRFRRRTLGHHGTPSHSAFADPTERYFPERRSVSQDEIAGDGRRPE